MYQEIINATIQTLIMTVGAGLLTVCIGLPVAVVLAQMSHKKKLPKPLAMLLDVVLFIPQRIPYLVWMILLIPVTQMITKGRLDSYVAAIVPLTLATLPYFIQHVTHHLKSISPRLLETTMSYGANFWQQIQTVYFGEGRNAIVENIGRTFVLLIGFSTIVGALSGGGLGEVALQYSQDFKLEPLLIVTGILFGLTVVVEGTSKLILKNINL